MPTYGVLNTRRHWRLESGRTPLRPQGGPDLDKATDEVGRSALTVRNQRAAVQGGISYCGYEQNGGPAAAANVRRGEASWGVNRTGRPVERPLSALRKTRSKASISPAAGGSRSLT